VTLIQFANAFAMAITFARWRRHSEATTVTYGANFLFLCHIMMYRMLLYLIDLPVMQEESDL